MGFDTYLIRSTENDYDRKTKTSQITEQIIWEGEGAELGIYFTSLIAGQLRGLIGLIELQTFAEEYRDYDEQLNELLEVIQTQLTQGDSPDETYYRLEINY